MIKGISPNLCRWKHKEPQPHLANKHKQWKTSWKNKKRSRGTREMPGWIKMSADTCPTNHRAHWRGTGDIPRIPHGMFLSSGAAVSAVARGLYSVCITVFVRLSRRALRPAFPYSPLRFYVYGACDHAWSRRAT